MCRQPGSWFSTWRSSRDHRMNTIRDAEALRLQREIVMVEIGSIIRATVSRVEPYGVWMDHPAGPVLVLVPEVSWSDRRPPSQWMRPGDEFDVYVLRYNYRDRVIVGSMRRLRPEENPYRQLARLEPGTVLRGRARLIAGDAVSVALANGAWGDISRASLPAD